MQYLNRRSSARLKGTQHLRAERQKSTQESYEHVYPGEKTVEWIKSLFNKNITEKHWDAHLRILSALISKRGVRTLNNAHSYNIVNDVSRLNTQIEGLNNNRIKVPEHWLPQQEAFKNITQGQQAVWTRTKLLTPFQGLSPFLTTPD